MELTIEQALQQGVAAHKEGNFQVAERLYRAILESQPLHPDANHNLGVLSVSVNTAQAALPLFQIALEANPKIDQFWLSYIDALIKEEKFEDAKLVIEQARTQHVVGDKLDNLEGQILLRKQEPITASVSPPREQLSRLLDDYQNGRLSDAEKLATSISHEFPLHNFSWKILGAVLKKTDRASEAVFAGEKAIEIAPEDAEAYFNLGNTLQELGRFYEAEARYKQAIALAPNYEEAHCNLGNALQELGRSEEAEASLRQAIALKPDFAKAHINLGNTLNEQGRLDQAEVMLRRAIALKPDNEESHYIYGITLEELGRLDEAEASLRQAIALKPDYALAHYSLGKVLYIKGNEDLALKSIVIANDIEPQSKDYELMRSLIQARNSRKKNEAADVYTSTKHSLGGLISSPLILNRLVESELITSLYEMNSINLDKTNRVVLLASGKNDARYGNGIVSPDFNLFRDTRFIIKKVSEDLTNIMMEAVKSDIYIYDSFFNILRAGGGLTPHNHLFPIDRNIALDLGKQKYSLVYYLSVGDQNCKEPGILKFYEPGEEILPYAGMIAIFPSSRMHSAVYGGKTDRVMIGVNFYSL